MVLRGDSLVRFGGSNKNFHLQILLNVMMCMCILNMSSLFPSASWNVNSRDLTNTCCSNAGWCAEAVMLSVDTHEA